MVFRKRTNGIEIMVTVDGFDAAETRDAIRKVMSATSASTKFTQPVPSTFKYILMTQSRFITKCSTRPAVGESLNTRILTIVALSTDGAKPVESVR